MCRLWSIFFACCLVLCVFGVVVVDGVLCVVGCLLCVVNCLLFFGVYYLLCFGFMCFCSLVVVVLFVACCLLCIVY